MTNDKDRYSRVEREVLELLDDIETDQEPKRPANIVEFRKPVRNRFSWLTLPDLSDIRYRLSPAKLLLVVLAAIVGAVMLQGVPYVVPLLIVVAIAAFVGVFFTRSKPSLGGRSSQKPGVKRWRGRDIDLTKRS